MRFFKKIIPAILSICFCSGVYAQQQQIAEARAAMESLYQLYDSTAFITFDVKYNYLTDTVYGDFQNEYMDATYTMSGKKAKFNMGNIEYIQNDSFFITIYNKEKIIIVANSREQNSGSYMPLRGVIDSVLDAYSSHYAISVQNDINDTNGYILFERSDSLAMFDEFRINFNTREKYLTGIVYTFMETSYPQSDGDSTSGGGGDKPLIHQRTLKIDFTNYRFDNMDSDIYSENNYIWDDAGEFKPVTKYYGFKVYNSR